MHGKDGTPAADFGARLAYDDTRQRVVLQQGATLWEYDGAGWTTMFTTGLTPTGRYNGGFVYDAWRREYVLFGGENSVGDGDLGDMQHLRFLSSWPEEQCGSGSDEDQDGLADCADSDCGMLPAWTCGNGVCDGFEHPGVCPADCP